MKKSLIISIVVTILAIGATGGGVWYWQSQKIKKQETENNKKIEELQKKVEELNKEKTENWATYENESFGLSFKYPPSYAISASGPLKEGESNTGSISLIDNTRKGHPRLSLLFNPDGIGGCMLDSNDLYFKTQIKNGKLSIIQREEQKDSPCDWNEAIGILFDIGRYSRTNDIIKNGILGRFDFDEGSNYEDEIKKIIETIRITKDNIYGSPDRLIF